VPGSQAGAKAPDCAAAFVGLQSDAVPDISDSVGLKSDLQSPCKPLWYCLAGQAAGRMGIGLQLSGKTGLAADARHSSAQRPAGDVR